MADLARHEMEDIMLAHEKAELEYDVEATMATLVANPHFELPSLGIAIDGWEGVHAVYSHMVIKGGKDRNIQAVARIIGEAKNTLLREAWVTYDNRDGERVTGVYLVVMEFSPEEKKIVGERMYADTVYHELLVDMLGSQIQSVPGVSKISDSAPQIEVHDAFELAASRGVTINNPRVNL